MRSSAIWRPRTGICAEAADRPPPRRNPSSRLRHARCFSRGAITRERARAIIGAPMSTSVVARAGGSDPVNRNIGRQPEASLPLISGMRPVGMKRAAILLTALAVLWAAPAHAQTDFLTLQENVDASGTALMCPTRADNYVDCADAGTLPVPSVRGRAALGQPRRTTAHHGHDRHSRREAHRRGLQDHLYLRAHGEGRHRGGAGDHAGHGHSRRHHFSEY